MSAKDGKTVKEFLDKIIDNQNALVGAQLSVMTALLATLSSSGALDLVQFRELLKRSVDTLEGAGAEATSSQLYRYVLESVDDIAASLPLSIVLSRNSLTVLPSLQKGGTQESPPDH